MTELEHRARGVDHVAYPTFDAAGTVRFYRDVLGFRPRRGFGDSLGELAEWVRRQQAVDRVAEARRELEQRGLVA